MQRDLDEGREGEAAGEPQAPTVAEEAARSPLLRYLVAHFLEDGTPSVPKSPLAPVAVPEVLADGRTKPG